MLKEDLLSDGKYLITFAHPASCDPRIPIMLGNISTNRKILLNVASIIHVVVIVPCFGVCYS